MGKTLLIALRATVVTLALTGIAYPFVVTAIAQTLFPRRAEGSFVTDERGEVAGSDLIGQRFAEPWYFQGRPSAAGNEGYDASSSGGSNFGVTSARLRARVAGETARLLRENPEAKLPIPAELVATSASGLDPHLSPAAVRWQIPRVAKARGVAPSRLAALVESQIEDRDLLVFGEPRVNLLALNLAVDRQFGRHSGKLPGALP